MQYISSGKKIVTKLKIPQLGQLICWMEKKLKIPLFVTNLFDNKSSEEFKKAQLDDSIICKI